MKLKITRKLESGTRDGLDVEEEDEKEVRVDK